MCDACVAQYAEQFRAAKKAGYTLSDVLNACQDMVAGMLASGTEDAGFIAHTVTYTKRAMLDVYGVTPAELDALCVERIEQVRVRIEQVQARWTSSNRSLN